ncbi:MAG: hypothetical protein C4523_17945 [Myxococcales bacterium]|nr:MAG: hypothetical protein C4523_17945 [Myxococcales bacterium]
MERAMTRHLFALAAVAAIVGAAGHAWAYSTIRTDSGQELHWGVEQIPVNFYLDQDGAPNVSFDALQVAVQAAFAAWGNVDCSILGFKDGGVVDVGPADVATTNGYDKKNVVIWIEENQWENEWTDAFMITVPVFDTRTAKILDADILGNKTFDWSAGAEGQVGKADAQNIVTHEVGHLLGLDHSPYLDATMYYSALEGETYKRTLAADDIQGLCHLYPNPGKNGFPCAGDADCDADNRCLEHEASGGTICSTPCECDPDCPAAFECQQRQCLPPEAEVGGIGSHCGQTMPCGSDDLICVSDVCTKYCTSVMDCPRGWACRPLVGGDSACYPANPDDLNPEDDPGSDVAIISFGAEPESPVSIGEQVTLSVAAAGGESLLYRFSAREAGGEWTYLKDYSILNVSHWIPETVGSFEIKAEVKDENSDECADAESIVPFNVTQGGEDGDSPSVDGDETIVTDDDGGSSGCQGATPGNPLVALCALTLALAALRARFF